MKTKKIVVAALLTVIAGTFSATALAEETNNIPRSAQSDSQTKDLPTPPRNQNDDGARSVPDPVGPSVDLPVVPSTDD